MASLAFRKQIEICGDCIYWQRTTEYGEFIPAIYACKLGYAVKSWSKPCRQAINRSEAKEHQRKRWSW